MFNPVEVIEYAIDTSSNLVIYHFIMDLEKNQIRARAIGVNDPDGTFILPVHDKFYHVDVPLEVKKNPKSLIMQEQRDVFLILPILNVYDD
jgi:hypothetical protein